MDMNSTLIKVLLVLMALLGLALVAIPGACGLLLVFANFETGGFNPTNYGPILLLAGVPVAVGVALLIGAWVGAKAQRQAANEARALEAWAEQAAAAAVADQGSAEGAPGDHLEPPAP